MRFRLRYQQHDLELTEGEFAVGRNASCQLSLDDPLVSRRHALLYVTQGGVQIEDLGSRNGVLVNGVRIEGRVTVTAGDRILIGSQEMTLLHARDGLSAPHTAAANMPMSKMTLPKMPAAVSHIPMALDAISSSREGGDVEPSMIRRADQFKLLGGVAEKALAMGRAAEAERLLASALADVIEASRAGRGLPPSLVDQAAKFSSKLATATAKADGRTT